MMMVSLCFWVGQFLAKWGPWQMKQEMLAWVVGLVCCWLGDGLLVVGKRGLLVRDGSP